MSQVNPSKSSAELSAGVRSTLSLVLFIHLFAIAVALSSYTNPSGVQSRLREMLAIYAQNLNFDLNQNAYNVARFHQTHATPSDVDFQITIESADGSRKQLIPEDSLFPPLRQRRYQSLANAIGNMAESEEYQAVLPRAIAASVLNDWNVKSGKFLCRGHFLPDIEFRASSDPKVQDPYSETYYRTAYEATVVVTPDQVYVNKISTARDVAPVEQSPGAGGKGPRP
jgi:hypothetical protein